MTTENHPGNMEINTGSTWFNRFLTIVEKPGNALPHPTTPFAVFALSAF